MQPQHQAGASGASTRAAPLVSRAAAEHRRLAGGTWVYPSEQMFFNAMRRKGWSPREEDMAR